VSGSHRGRALLISENAPLPGDRRVWNEARTLREAGWEVLAVCAEAADRQQPPVETIEGVKIHRYPLRPAEGALDYAREYAQALWRIRALVRRLQRERPFDVVHVATPPDFLLLAARSARRRGSRFIFDHHDLTPELFRSRFGRGGVLHRVLLAIERRAMRAADVVISTNESYRRIAIERGGVDPADVFVVRNGPDLERFQPVKPDPELRRGRRHLLAYLGVMGPQDGIDHALGALAKLRGLRDDDWHAVFIGEGEVRAEMEALATRLGLGDSVEFAGWRGDEDIRRFLSTADVGLEPDPPSPLNDRSTMIKVTEYMAMGCPVAAYDLEETRVSAGTAAAYAAAATPDALGRCIHELLEDPQRRQRMREYARERVVDLSWQRSAAVLLAAYEQAMKSEQASAEADARLGASTAGVIG
jgi:glycosyltransferase involved in cell wall biosynthesis